MYRPCRQARRRLLSEWQMQADEMTLKRWRSPLTYSTRQTSRPSRFQQGPSVKPTVRRCMLTEELERGLGASVAGALPPGPEFDSVDGRDFRNADCARRIIIYRSGGGRAWASGHARTLYFYLCAASGLWLRCRRHEERPRLIWRRQRGEASPDEPPVRTKCGT